MLAQPDAILVQTEEDARRYVIAGAPPERVKVGGNLKYDFTPPASGIAPEIAAFLTDQARTSLDRRQHHASGGAGDVDEDDAVIEAFQEIGAPIRDCC